MDISKIPINVVVLNNKAEKIVLNAPIPPMVKTIDVLSDIYDNVSQNKTLVTCLICLRFGDDYSKNINVAGLRAALKFQYPNGREELLSHLYEIGRTAGKTSYTKDLKELSSTLLHYATELNQDGTSMKEYIDTLVAAVDNQWDNYDVIGWNTRPIPEEVPSTPRRTAPSRRVLAPRVPTTPRHATPSSRVLEEPVPVKKPIEEKDIDLEIKYTLPNGDEGTVEINYTKFGQGTYLELLTGVADLINEDTDVPALYFILMPMSIRGIRGGGIVDPSSDVVLPKKGSSLHVGNSESAADDISSWIDELLKSIPERRRLYKQVSMANDIFSKINSKKGTIDEQVHKIASAVESLIDIM